jgi:DNA polymerase-1
MEIKEKKFLLIDGSGMLYRAFFALPHFLTKKGEPTGAVYGFLLMILRVIKDENPDYLAVAFDRKALTARHIEYKEYKATRPPMPDELSKQFETIREVLQAFQIPMYEIDGFEADDVIATIVEQLKHENTKILIVTGDMDLTQLISDKVLLLMTRKGVTNIEKFDKIKLKETLGISPEQVPDYKALVGDSSDNIQGVPGVGPKTALKLLNKYNNIEYLTEHLEEEHLEKYKDKIFQNKSLCTLIRDVPIKFDIEATKIQDFKTEKAKEILLRLEFKNIIKELGIENNNISDTSRNPNLNRIGLYFETSKKESLGFAYADKDSELEYRIGEELFTNQESLKKLKDLLADENIQKEVYDLKEVLTTAKKYDLPVKNIHFDISLIAYLLDPSLNSYSLESLSKTFSIPIKGKSMKDKARFIYKAATLEESLLKGNGLLKIYEEIEKPLAEVLLDMEKSGIKIDVSYFKELEKVIEQELKVLEGKIYKLAGISFNILSSKQLASVLYDILGLEPSKRGKTGFSTSSEILEEMAEEHPIIPELLQYRSLSKLYSTYIQAFPHLISKDDGKLHTHFHQIGTSTGRLRSSDPNLQNIPIKGEWGEKIRKGFIATDDKHFLISADYSQIELRILAHLSQDSILINAFKNDEDIHIHTASMVFGVEENAVTKEMRSRAKAINFGIIYGISPYGLSKQLGCTQEESAEYIRRYFQKYRGVKEFIESLIKRTMETGEAKTILGRTRKVEGLDSKNYNTRENARRIAINSPIQGSAADIIKIAMVNIYNEIKSLEAHILLQIHDELIVESHEDILDKIISITKEKMEHAYELSIPLKVNVGKGKNLLEAKT